MRLLNHKQNWTPEHKHGNKKSDTEHTHTQPNFTCRPSIHGISQHLCPVASLKIHPIPTNIDVLTSQCQSKINVAAAFHSNSQLHPMKSLPVPKVITDTPFPVKRAAPFYGDYGSDCVCLCVCIVYVWIAKCADILLWQTNALNCAFHMLW